MIGGGGRGEDLSETGGVSLGTILYVLASGDYKVAPKERPTFWKSSKFTVKPSAVSVIAFSNCKYCSCKFKIALIPNHPCFFSATLPVSAEQELGSPVHVVKMLGQYNDTPYFAANAWWKSNLGLELPEAQTEEITLSTLLAVQEASSRVTGWLSPQLSAAVPPVLGWMLKILGSMGGMLRAAERVVRDRRRRRRRRKLVEVALIVLACGVCYALS
jgi:hypothetical protein